MVELDDLLARADVISLHLALNDETRGFLDEIGWAHEARSHPGQHRARRPGGRGALIDAYQAATSATPASTSFTPSP